MVRWGEKNDNIVGEVAVFSTGFGVVLLCLGLWMALWEDSSPRSTDFEVTRRTLIIIVLCSSGAAMALCGGLVFLTRSKVSIVLAILISASPFVASVAVLISTGAALKSGRPFFFLLVVTAFIFIRGFKALKEIDQVKKDRLVENDP